MKQDSLIVEDQCNLDLITVVIITKNEARNISRCLESVKAFQHRLVLDSGSTDETVQIAANLGARVVHQDWLGFGKQKQMAMDLANTEWILSLDADEELSETSVQAIEKLDLSAESVGFEINRKTFFLGKLIQFSGWNPDWVLRLANKRIAKFTSDAVHERLTGCTTIKKINGCIWHHSYQSKSDIDKKIKLYGTLSQLSRRKQKNRVVTASWSFFRSYVLHLGFLDGKAGFQIAKMNAKTNWIKYTNHSAE